jgi:hypothetical protein
MVANCATVGINPILPELFHNVVKSVTVIFEDGGVGGGAVVIDMEEIVSVGVVQVGAVAPSMICLADVLYL